MIIKEKDSLGEEISTDVICDSCGNSCRRNFDSNNPKFILNDGEVFFSCEYMKIKACWGVLSKKDSEKWDAHVCEECADTKFPFIKFQKEIL